MRSLSFGSRYISPSPAGLCDRCVAATIWLTRTYYHRSTSHAQRRLLAAEASPGIPRVKLDSARGTWQRRDLKQSHCISPLSSTSVHLPSWRMPRFHVSLYSNDPPPPSADPSRRQGLVVQGIYPARNGAPLLIRYADLWRLGRIVSLETARLKSARRSRREMCFVRHHR